MGFLGRIGNLMKGAWITRNSPRETIDEAALQAELARPTPAQRGAAEEELARLERGEAAPTPPAEPERDEHGNVRRRL